MGAAWDKLGDELKEKVMAWKEAKARNRINSRDDLFDLAVSICNKRKLEYQMGVVDESEARRETK